MTGDPTRDHEASEHDFNSLPVSEYAAEAAVKAEKEAALAEREAEQKARMDAAHEKAKAEREQCANSTRVDGPWHTWRFDGDDPYVICVFCGKRQDALTGEVVTP